MMIKLGACFAAAMIAATGIGFPAPPAAVSSYPAMAPLSAYLMPDRGSEIALARSAAPPSVSAGAEILVLGPDGYATAVPGKNGFTCLVERAWFSGLNDDGFWNPILRGPDCYNREAARSVLPTYLTRTRWVLAGATQSEIRERTHAAMAAGQIHAPDIGSMNFMLSKQGYLGDRAHGPWHPHLMFYMPPMATSDWGADLPGTHVYGAEAGVDPYAMFFVTVAKWSDGTDDHPSGASAAM